METYLLHLFMEVANFGLTKSTEVQILPDPADAFEIFAIFFSLFNWLKLALFFFFGHGLQVIDSMLSAAIKSLFSVVFSVLSQKKGEVPFLR